MGENGGKDLPEGGGGQPGKSKTKAGKRAKIDASTGLRRKIDQGLCLDRCRDVGLISCEASWDKGKEEGEVRPQASEV